MKLNKSIPILLFMFSVVELFAQKKTSDLTWQIAGELPPLDGQLVSPGVAGPVTGVDNNKMFVAGGANFPDRMPWQGGKKRYYNSIFVFAKRNKRLIGLKGNFKLPENIAYTANCTTPKGVFFGGGENESGISDKAFLLQWDDASKTVVFKQLPNLPLAVTNASATFCSNIVFVVGGESNTAVSNKCWSLNLNNTESGWKELADLPKPASHSVLAAIKKGGYINLYLAGGRKRNQGGVSEFYNSVYEFNTSIRQWKELSPLPYALSAGTGIAVGNSRFILFGGDRGTTFCKVEEYIAAITKTTNEQEKEQLIQQKNKLLAAHPGFSKEILIYDITTGKCKPSGVLPYQTPVTTTALLWDKDVYIPCGEIKAGVRTPKILMAKIKRWLK